MIESSAYPEVAGLVVELLGLDEMDAQLPLGILLGVHRSALAAPFNGLLALANRLPALPVSVPRRPYIGEVFQQLIGVLNERYPALEDGELFMECEELDALENEGQATHVAIGLPEWQQIEHQGGLPAQILAAYDVGWECYEPVMFMLQLSWQLTPALRENRVRALELELEFNPAVRQLILDMAAEAARPMSFG